MPTRQRVRRWIQPGMGLLVAWAALAQIAPDSFQLRRINLTPSALAWLAVLAAVTWGLVLLNQVADRVEASTAVTAVAVADDQATLRLRIWTTLQDTDDVFLSVTNDGPTDSFVAQVTTHLGTYDYVSCPYTIRWEHSPNDKKEIVHGQTARLHVVQIVPRADTDDVGVDALRFMGPTNDASVRPNIDLHDANTRVYRLVSIFIQITSATTGYKRRVHLGVEPFASARKVYARVNIFAD